MMNGSGRIVKEKLLTSKSFIGLAVAGVVVDKPNPLKLLPLDPNVLGLNIL